ncbi:DegT/DnrJ/EryC1/StrS aminotransferase family protein, partial [Brevundimonas sp.]|uniref:DegT/DnrJ/EryC1/StrS family aminotransferase n=1 Tax=Brevundimonas sp. TaxID=1871086 RepID=UPI0025C1489B
MIPFIDLQAQRARLGQPLEDAILKVVRSGAYIMGPEIAQLEAALAAFGQAPHALSCASGTDALVLPLMAWGIGPGDAVFCPSFTFAATAEAVALVGASPVFVDILPDTYNLDPATLEAAIQAVKSDLEGKTFDHDPKYLNMRVGMNSRMDTIQAAVLLQKLTIFADEIGARNRVAARYAEGLSDVVATPQVIDGGVSVWAQYTIETDDRDGLGAALREQGVPTAVYYPMPLHRQPPYAACPQPGGLPVTEAKAG